MGFFTQACEFFLSAARAQARWEIEVSNAILKSRRKLLFLIALAAPVFALCAAEAAGTPVMLGGSAAYAPAFSTLPVFLASIGIGVGAGLITGCIGAGGGFIITPALMAMGIKGILAVGTDLFHIFAKAIMGSAIHRRLGNISIPLAASFLAGSILGTFAGGAVNKALYAYDPLLSDLFISAIYALLLGFLGFYALFDMLRHRKAPQDGAQDAALTGAARAAQGLRLPPMIAFDEKVVPGGRRISAWIVAAGGFFVGLLAAIMGVGGGFVTFPMFVYGFGVSSLTTVGTDIFQIVFTAGFAAIGQYAIYGYMFYALAVGMLLGSLLGIQIGALTTTVVSERHIRGFYAVAILSGFFNRAAALPKRLAEMEVISWPAALVNGIQTAGNAVFWLAVAVFGVWVTGKFFANLSRLRGSETGGEKPC